MKNKNIEDNSHDDFLRDLELLKNKIESFKKSIRQQYRWLKNRISSANLCNKNHLLSELGDFIHANRCRYNRIFRETAVLYQILLFELDTTKVQKKKYGSVVKAILKEYEKTGKVLYKIFKKIRDDERFTKGYFIVAIEKYYKMNAGIHGPMMTRAFFEDLKQQLKTFNDSVWREEKIQVRVINDEDKE